MSRLLLLLTLAVLTGCGPSKRRHGGGTDDDDDKTQDVAQRDKPGADKPGGGNPDVGTKRPGGGVGTAVQRAVNLNEMQNIQKFIQIAELDFNRMPTKQEVMQSMQRDAPKICELVQSGAIVITGTKNREGVWAYTFQPQSTAGEHLVVTSSSCGRMPAEELKRLLQQQGP